MYTPRASFPEHKSGIKVESNEVTLKKKKQTVLLTKLLTKAFVHIVINYFFKLIYLVPAISSKNILLYNLPDFHIIQSFSHFNTKEVSI